MENRENGRKWTLAWIRRAAMMMAVVMLMIPCMAMGEENTENAAFRTVGNTVTFGSYEQDNNTENGPEAIEWIVLDVQEGKSLLLSRYGLEMKAFNDEFASVTWENSPLREWLNTTFMDTAFSGEERAAILTTDVDNSMDQGLSAYALPGNNTQDQVFLLSYHEVFSIYFHDNDSRRCATTAHVVSQDGWVASNDEVDGAEACWWWTRSPGIQSNAADVGRDGKRYFLNVDVVSGCVRPALWIELK